MVLDARCTGPGGTVIIRLNFAEISAKTAIIRSGWALKQLDESIRSICESIEN